MLEYDVTLNVKVENKEMLENLVITVESVNSNMDKTCSINLLNLNISEVKKVIYNHSKNKWTQQYELDSWLSPINLKLD